MPSYESYQRTSGAGKKPKSGQSLGQLARMPRRSFKAGQQSNQTHGWTSSPAPLDKGLEQHLSRIRARSRDLSLNNDYGRKFIHMARAHVVGHNGIALQSRLRDRQGKLDVADNTDIEQAFIRWGRPGNADATGRLSWWDCQRMFIQTVAVDGECFVRFRRRGPFGFQLQFLDSETIPTDLKFTAKNGHQVFQGIEYNSIGRPVAYYQRTSSRREQYRTNTRLLRIPASEMLHCFISEQVSQGRGFPWMASAMLRMNMLVDYEETELVASQVGSSKMAFIERNNSGDGWDGDGSASDYDDLVSEAEPGAFEHIPHGSKVHEFNPNHPSTAFKDFVSASLRGAASGLGVSYNTLANDLSDVNFSSMRHGAHEEREIWMSLQKWMITYFCTPIYERWLMGASLTNQVAVPFAVGTAEFPHSWQPRRWGAVDPLKESQTNANALAMRITSRSQILRDAGFDPLEVWQEIADETRILSEMGINPEAIPYGTPPESEATDPVSDSASND
ncbi:MAG: phage portal protein [Pseudomonadota bacterium]